MSIALSILREVFGYQALRGPQAEIIDHVMGGGDALVLMPTGGGKSLCYQIPAIARQRAGHGITVVVSPLIALMHDQVGALHEAGVSAAFLNSTLTPEEASDTERRLMRGDITLLYAAPERVTTSRFLAQMDSLQERGLLSLFAIAFHRDPLFLAIPAPLLSWRSFLSCRPRSAGVCRLTFCPLRSCSSLPSLRSCLACSPC